MAVPAANGKDLSWASPNLRAKRGKEAEAGRAPREDRAGARSHVALPLTPLDRPPLLHSAHTFGRIPLPRRRPGPL